VKATQPSKEKTPEASKPQYSPRQTHQVACEQMRKSLKVKKPRLKVDMIYHENCCTKSARIPVTEKYTVAK
jgi:hypothetical protein